MTERDDPLDAIAKSMKARRKKGSKATRTHNLGEPNYTVFAAYCRSKDQAASDVIDDLIAAFLQKVRDDLPRNLQQQLGFIPPDPNGQDK